MYFYCISHIWVFLVNDEARCLVLYPLQHVMIIRDLEARWMGTGEQLSMEKIMDFKGFFFFFCLRYVRICRDLSGLLSPVPFCSYGLSLNPVMLITGLIFATFLELYLFLSIDMLLDFTPLNTHTWTGLFFFFSFSELWGLDASLCTRLACSVSVPLEATIYMASST